MKGFQKGDQRAVAAGRKGGRARRSRQSLDYVRGYRSGSRTTLRRLLRWMQERGAA